jgi:hypothetical protein
MYLRLSRLDGWRVSRSRLTRERLVRGRDAVGPLFAPPAAMITTGVDAPVSNQAAWALDFATWVAIASISAGDRQS